MRFQRPGIQTHPTESDSSQEDEEESWDSSLHSNDSSSHNMALRIPSHLSPTNASRQQKPHSDNENLQRLVLMAKHPNVVVDPIVKRKSRVEFDKAGPIDADTGRAWKSEKVKEEVNHSPLWDQTLDDEDLSTTTFKKPSSIRSWVSGFFPTSAAAAATDNSISKQSQSISSDKTPKISNVSDTKEGGGRCRRLFNTRSGLIIVALTLVVLLAVIVTVAAAIASQPKDDANSLRFVPGSIVPREPLEPSATPSASSSSSVPSAAPSTSVPTTSAPVEEAMGNASAGTAAPTPSPVEKPPEFFAPVPTLNPTTLSPTVAPSSRPSLRATLPPTKPPTQAPTKAPTLSPTARPTRSPTPAPVTPSPSDSPTKSPEPTTSPTTIFSAVDLQPLAESLLGTEIGQRFGYAMALSHDGQVIAVGAPLATVQGNAQAGMVQVYELRNGAWVTRGPALVGRNAQDQFGSSVSLSEDGSILACGEPTYDGTAGDRSGSVRVFVYGPTNRYDALGQEIQGEAATDYFGVSLQLSANGRRLAVGAPYHDNGTSGTRNISGHVKVYDYVSGVWQIMGSPLQGLSHLDWFGSIVDLSGDGTTLCVGAPRNLQYGGYVQCFQHSAATWSSLGGVIHNAIAPIRYGDNWGLSISMSGNDRLAIGSPGKRTGGVTAGVTAVYELVSDVWTLMGNTPVVPSTPGEGNQFGFSVQLVNNVLAVGSPGNARVELYEWSSLGSWLPHSPSLQGTGDFGGAVQLTREFALAVATTMSSIAGRVDVYVPL